MKKLYLASGVLILMICLVTANSFIFQEDEAINFRFRCLDQDNQYCTSTTQVIISIEAPNGTNVIDNSSMQHNPTFFNHSLPTSNSGVYNALIISIGSNTSTEFTYLVNPSGIFPSDQRTEAVTRTVYFMFGIAILLFIGFLFSRQSMPAKWTYFIFSVIFFLIGLNLLSVSIVDEVVNPRIENFLDGFTAISFIFYWFAGGLLILLWIFTFFNTFMLKKNIRNAQRFG